MKMLVVLASLIAPLVAFAGDFTVAPVTITLPKGFEGAQRQEMQNAVTVGFTKSSSLAVKPLLQISIYNFGSRLKTINEAERSAAASKYLLDFLGGVARRRTDFNRTEPTMLHISRLPAAKLRWTGNVGGIKMVGVMYCFIAGSRVISFHTQDVGSTPTPAMIEAMGAFEAASVKLDG